MQDTDALWAEYRARRARRRRGGAVGVVVDVLMFRRMLTPMLIRGVFLMVLVGAVWACANAVAETIRAAAAAGPVGASAVGVVPGAAAGRPGAAGSPVWSGGTVGSPSYSAGQPRVLVRAPGWLSDLAINVGGIVAAVIFLRIVFEGMIVLFVINEDVGEIRRRVAGGGGGRWQHDGR